MKIDKLIEDISQLNSDKEDFPHLHITEEAYLNCANQFFDALDEIHQEAYDVVGSPEWEKLRKVLKQKRP